MNSISVGELRALLEDYPDDYQVVMYITHKYPISKESGEKGWIANINGIDIDPFFRTIELMN